MAELPNMAANSPKGIWAKSDEKQDWDQSTKADLETLFKKTAHRAETDTLLENCDLTRQRRLWTPGTAHSF